MNKKLIVTLVVGAFSASANAEGLKLRLNPVVVSATRTEINSFDVPVSIDVVDGDTIRDNRLQANLSEISQRIPGVVINNRYNAAQELAISTRGFGARSLFGVKGVRIYADGIPLTTPDGQGQLGSISLDTVDRVEFIRGPFSALYGNSSGGIVQTFTRDGSKEQTLSGGLFFGSYNTRRETMTYEGQIDNFNYIVNASQVSSDGYRDHSEFRKNSINSKLSFKLSEDTKLTVIANYMDQPLTKDPLTLTPTAFRANPTQAGANAYTNDTRVTKEQTLGGIVLDHNFSDSDSIKFATYYGQRENLQYLTTAVSGISRDYGGFDFKWTHKGSLLSRPITMTAGINYDFMKDDRRRYRINGTQMGNMSRWEMQRAHNFDQYAQATYDLTDRLILIGGIRNSRVNVDIDDKFGVDNLSGSMEYSNTSPVFGATFKVTPVLNIYANYGKGFETPTFAEMTYTDTAGNGPNFGLMPSKSKNYEVGMKAFVADNTRVNLALFKVDTKNEMVVGGSDAGITWYKSIADTERKGLELSVDSRLPYNFNFYMAYTLMDAKFKNNFCATQDCINPTVLSGNKIPGTYQSTTYTELSWKYPQVGFSSAIEGIHFSETNGYDTNAIANKAPAYTLVNLRAGFTQNIGNWKITEFGRIDNVTDRSYVSNVKVNSADTFEPGATRNYLLGVNASYQF
jgi:iron complex outermembrane receptor protein